MEKNKIRVPRILPVAEKRGRFLPFPIPLFACLSATGALAGDAARIAKAVNDASATKQHLEESQRHNKTMKTIALIKVSTSSHTRKDSVYIWKLENQKSSCRKGL